MKTDLFSIVQQNSSSFGDLLPEISLSFAFLLCIVADLIWKKKAITLSLAFVGVITALFFTIEQLGIPEHTLFNGMLLINTSTVVFRILVLIGVLVALLAFLVDKQALAAPKGIGEYVILILGLTIGMHFMCLASHFLLMYLAVEMVSLLSYLLVAYFPAKRQGAEASMKYVVFGAVASAILLYGMSLLYGLTGTLQLSDPHFLAQLSQAPTGMVALALLMVLGGIFFKLSAVPFHFWTPDVYEASPVPVIILLSSAPKIAGFGLLVSFLSYFTFQLDRYQLIWPNFQWQHVLAIIAIITMTLGNLSAIGQQNVKRLLAWSSIAHTGFMLLALVAFSQTGQVALLFYLLTYLLMNAGAFGVVLLLEQRYQAVQLEDYKGLGKKSPFLAVLLIVFLISLIGLPATAGFIAKFLVFSAVLEAFRVNLNPILLGALILGVINTVIALFYYFKIARYLFLKKAEEEEVVNVPLNWPVVFLTILAVSIVLLGLFPSAIITSIDHVLSTEERFFFQP